jgi:S-adenosylmethionine:tRNA ribosyltransferase-isomerase
VTDDLLDYTLPPERIAQYPLARREDARLLVVERSGARLHDARVADLGNWLGSGDALELNEPRYSAAPRRAPADRRPC